MTSVPSVCGAPFYSVMKLAIGFGCVAALSHAQFLYVGSPYPVYDLRPDGTVQGFNYTPLSVYAIGPTGSLTSMGLSVAAGPGAVHPNRQFLYLATTAGAEQYSVGVNGALTPLSPLSDPNAKPLAIHPGGEFLYVAAGTGPSPVTGGRIDLRAYSLSASGTPGTIVSQAVLAPGSYHGPESHPDLVAMHPSGRFFYVDLVSRPQQSFIERFDIGPNGSLTGWRTESGQLTHPDEAPVAFWKPIDAMVIEPTGRFLYVSDDESRNGGVPPSERFPRIAAFSIGPSGVLTPIGFLPGLSGRIAAEPTGRFLYVLHSVYTPEQPSGPAVVCLRIGPDGLLTEVARTEIPGGTDLAADPSGQFVYVTGTEILAYRIGSSGALSFIGSVLNAGRGSSLLGIAGGGCSSVPQISKVAASPAVLWPPNHQMTRIVVSYDLATCGASTCSLNVISNQPVNGTDWQIIDAHHLLLRAERAGNSNGRIYTIGINCNGANGARSTASTTVTVPHDKGDKK